MQLIRLVIFVAYCLANGFFGRIIVTSIGLEYNYLSISIFLIITSIAAIICLYFTKQSEVRMR